MRYTKLTKNAHEPTRGSVCAAGYDLHACISNSLGTNNITIYPGETIKIGTGIAVEIPDGFFGGVYARSGLASKKGLAPANKVGVIDSDYRGELIVALHNHGDSPQVVSHGDRIAQLIIQPYAQVIFEEVEALGDTERGIGGFGSTDAK